MFANDLKISLIETDVVWENKKANMNQFEESLRFVPYNTDLIVLPELFTTGFIAEDHEAVANLAEKNTDATMQTLHKIAEEHNTAIAGSYLARTAGLFFNRAFMVESNGDENFYDKHHLFRMGGERLTFKEGKKRPEVLRYRGWNIMIVVCYDLRFPVWCRNTDNKYDVLIVVANWPKDRIEAWKTLLKARAIENGCYVCGVNRCGTDINGLEFTGDSMIVDFKGEVIAKREGATPAINAELSREALEKFRQHFPAWKDADKFELTEYKDD